MQKIKIFPAPHVELRIHVSDKMVADLRECRELVERTGNGKDCNNCSWADVDLFDTGMCELDTVWEKVLREK